MLNRHPGLCVAPESLFVMSLAHCYQAMDWDEQTVIRFLRDAWREERMIRWRVNTDRLCEVLQATARQRGSSFPRMCAEVYAEHARTCGKQGALIGDKNPHYALFVGELARLFPRARFLHLVRDPCDNVASYRRVRFDLSSPAALAHRWREYNRRVLDFQNAAPERVHRLRFEDLVAQPVDTLAAACRFLGVEPVAGMADGRRETEPISDLAWHTRLRGPLDPGRAGAERARMSAGDVRLVSFVCGRVAKDLGYSLPASSTLERRRLAAHSLPGRLLGWGLTRLEKALFRLPLAWRWRIIRTYRRLTGNRIS